MRSSDAAPVACGLAATLVVSGCFAPIDHTGRQCPCASGYACDPVTETCVPEGSASDVGVRLDAASLDGSSPDARDVVDAALPDAPGLDAPPIDAWEATDAFAASDAFRADAFSADAFSADARAIDAYTPTYEPCPTGAYLCDNFESLALTRVPPWGYSDGPPSRVMSPVFSGMGAGRFEGIAPDGDTASVGKAFSEGAPPTEVWVRAQVLVRPRLASGDMRDGGVFHLGDDTAPTYDNVTVTLSDATPSSRIAIGTYNTSADLAHPGMELDDGVWNCVAFHVVQGNPGLVELYVGSRRVVASMERVMFAGGAFRVIDVGLTYFDSSSDGMTIHVDDVAVGRGASPILCP